MADLGVWRVDGSKPDRVNRSRVDLEEQLENWISKDSSLLANGLTVVGRQLRLYGRQLDLLAIDEPDRWVVIELKRARLDRDALAQALDYASSIAQMDADELEVLLRPGLSSFGDAQELARLVHRQLEGEKGPREVAVLLAGVGVDAGLERIVAHLGETYGVPIRIVSFDVFEPDGGPRLLIREVTEERSGRRLAQSDFPDLLHAALRRVGPGRWTTYGDLAKAIGSGAMAVAQHIAHCSEDACGKGYRVMTANGTVSPGFYWTDPSDERDPVEVLRAEGVAFDDRGRADPKSRLGTPALRGDDSQ